MNKMIFNQVFQINNNNNSNNVINNNKLNRYYLK